MTDVFEKSKTRGAARLVLLALADTASDEGQCFPSIKTLAKKSGVREQTTREYLHVFAKIGLVTVAGRGGEGRQSSNLYTIIRSQIGKDLITGAMLAEVRPPSSNNRKPLALSPSETPLTGGDTPPSHRGIPAPSHRGRYEPSVNRQKEPLRENPPRERTPLQKELSAIQALFAATTNIPEPKPNSQKEVSAAAELWYQPIRRIQAACNGTSLKCVELAVQKLRREGMTIASPKSIEKTCISIHGELVGAQNKPAELKYV